MCPNGCRRGCGTLIASRTCMFCFAAANIVKILDWRGCITVRWMTPADLAYYGAPAFVPDEAPDVALVGLLNVARRVFMELFAPDSWKGSNFTREKVEALAETQHARYCWHEPRCPRGAVKTWKALGASPL